MFTTDAARAALVCCASLLAAVAVSACGGAKTDTHAPTQRTASAAVAEPEIGAAAVRIGHHSLTPAMVAHWARVEGAFAYRTSGLPDHRSKPPRGLIPDPPSYAACIAYLAAEAGRAARPTRGALRGDCEREWLALRRHVLEILLTYYWTQEEARALRIVVTPSEVQRLLDAQFGSAQRFEQFRRASGESMSEERFLLTSKLQLKKLQERVSPLHAHTGHESAQMSASVDLAYQRLGAAMKRKWTPRTDCRAGYVVAECRQYRGPSGTGGAPGGV